MQRLRRGTTVPLGDPNLPQPLPPTLHRPVDEDQLNEFRWEIGGLISALIDLSSVDIFIAKPVDGGPQTSMRLNGSAAFFEERNGEFQLMALLLIDPPHKKDRLDVLTEYLLAIYDAKCFSAVGYPSRENVDDQKNPMYATGHRQASNGGAGHYKDRKETRPAEALGCLLASLVGLLMLRPFISGALVLNMFSILCAGGNIWASLLPFHLLCLTKNYNNEDHNDRNDWGMAFIAWLTFGDLQDDNGGAFRLTDYGVEFIPRHGSILWFDATQVKHHTEAISGNSPISGRLGMALQVRKCNSQREKRIVAL